MNEHLIKALVGLRAAVGAGSFLAPKLTGGLFGLDVDGNPQAPYLARLFGIRDVALAYGIAVTSGEVRTQWLHPGFKLELFRDEAEGYYLNLSSNKPFVFVNWLEEEGAGVPKAVTVSYNEAARLMDAGARVDGVPMPPQWIPWLAEYVERNYKPEPKKRSRPPSFKGAKRDER